jgi:hypothetical protein
VNQHDFFILLLVGIVYPQVADGGTASNMEGSCECIE